MSESHGKNGVPSFLIEKPYGELRGSLRPPPQALPSISETKASSHSLSFATMAAKLSISEAGTDVPSVWPMTKVPEAHNTGGGKDRMYRQFEFSIGTVFSAYLHEEYNSKNDDLDRYNKIRGRYILSKYRKFVIVAKFNEHFIALPIYTFGGKGLTTLPQGRNEFVSIRDNDKWPHAPSESKHPSIIYSCLPSPGKVRPKWECMTDRTVVYLTHPVTFDYSVACTIMGRIIPDHMQRLCTLFSEAMGLGICLPNSKDESADDGNSRNWNVVLNSTQRSRKSHASQLRRKASQNALPSIAERDRYTYKFSSNESCMTKGRRP